MSEDDSAAPAYDDDEDEEEALDEMPSREALPKEVRDPRGLRPDIKTLSV